jgi:hypothetical protein
MLDGRGREPQALGRPPLAPLELSTLIDRVQGADIRDRAVWLSADDATDGVYRVDLATGKVAAICTS